MRTLILAAAIGCCLASPGFAKTFELPDANPAVVVTLPNGWKPSEVEKGVEATSADGETYIAVETATAKGMETLIDEDIDFLTKQGVVIDKSTQETKDTAMNDMKVSFLHWQGKDKDGPTAVTLGIFGVSDNLVLLLTAWSSPAGDKKHGDELTKILESIKRR
jgi:hypothetical protein